MSFHKMPKYTTSKGNTGPKKVKKVMQGVHMGTKKGVTRRKTGKVGKGMMQYI